jgi:hypothetical protein
MQQSLNPCVIFLAICVILTSCGTDTAPPAAESPENYVELSLGDDDYTLPIRLCQLAAGFVMIKGWRENSSVSMSYDGQETRVNFQQDFVQRGIHYRDEWQSQHDAEHSTNGSTVTASGTIKIIGRYRLEVGQEGKWVRLSESDPRRNRPFKLSVTCE